MSQFRKILYNFIADRLQFTYHYGDIIICMHFLKDSLLSCESKRTLANEVHESTWQEKERPSFGRHTNNCLPGESSSRRCSGHNWLPLYQIGTRRSRFLEDSQLKRLKSIRQDGSILDVKRFRVRKMFLCCYFIIACGQFFLAINIKYKQTAINYKRENSLRNSSRVKQISL